MTEFLRILLIIVEALCSLMLVGLVLLQKSRSEGLGMAFGAGMGETLFGSRAGNVLTRATVVLGSIFLVNTLLLAMIYAGRREVLPIPTNMASPPATQAPATPGLPEAAAPLAPAATVPATTVPAAPLPAAAPATPAPSADAPTTTPAPAPAAAPTPANPATGAAEPPK